MGFIEASLEELLVSAKLGQSFFATKISAPGPSSFVWFRHTNRLKRGSAEPMDGPTPTEAVQPHLWREDRSYPLEGSYQHSRPYLTREAPGLSAVFSGLVHLRMLASSSMSKLVFMILVLHCTFA